MAQLIARDANLRVVRYAKLIFNPKFPSRVGPRDLQADTGISSTSAVTGSVGVISPVVPASIVSTSGMSASVVALKRVAPAGVLATSGVSGTVTGRVAYCR